MLAYLLMLEFVALSIFPGWLVPIEAWAAGLVLVLVLLGPLAAFLVLKGGYVEGVTLSFIYVIAVAIVGLGDWALVKWLRW